MPVVLIDIGLTINVCPTRTAYALGLRPKDYTATTQAGRAYDNTQREVLGIVRLRVDVGTNEHDMKFHIKGVPGSFNMLLGRPWMHQLQAIPSVVSQ